MLDSSVTGEDLEDQTRLDWAGWRTLLFCFKVCVDVRLYNALAFLYY